MSVNRLMLAALLCAAAVLAGCQGTRARLKAPARVPSFVPTYRNDSLRTTMQTRPTALTLSTCAETATVTEDAPFGPRDGGTVPVRELVEREFKKIVSANFRVCLPDETPQLLLDVRTNEVRIERHDDRSDCTMHFTVRLLTVVGGKSRQRFSRDYVSRTSAQPDGTATVPLCLYEAVQRTAADFVADLAAANAKSSSRHD